MILVKTKDELHHQLAAFRDKGTVGLVPTMGALHAGHLSLVDRAVFENSATVVSVFVNPTQFNDANDLKRYPRNLEADMELLRTTGCQIVFTPEVEEIYPEPDTRKFDFGELEKIMEGEHRPGHFNGVGQVVSKLFDIVNPNKAYFGLKDFQQLAVIKKLVKMMESAVQIVPCPIIREKNGLAMSSRNELLPKEARENAGLIYKTLTEAKNLTGLKSVEELKKWVKETINKNHWLNVEYFEVVDDENLRPVKSWEENSNKVGCIAVYAGQIRLIDNIVLNSKFRVMQIEICKSKIHKVSVTEANLQYVGSITIDEDLMDAANLIEHEKVQVVNINNGERLETYVIKGERGSGTICLNGPAARKAAVGDVVIIISYALMDFEQAKTFKPAIIFPDVETNQLL